MRHIFTLLLLISMNIPALAGTAQRPASVVKAEQYLNSLNSAKARFVQTAYDGSQVIGTFYLDRPGKLRFEYDEPIKDFIVADGFLIYFYDSELGEQTNAPIGVTLADFLLRPELHLGGDITVTNVNRKGGLLQITIVQTDDPDAGALTLGFTEDPFTLKKWRVTDSTDAITEIELFQLETDIKLAENLFVYSDPTRFTGENRYEYND